MGSYATDREFHDLPVRIHELCHCGVGHCILIQRRAQITEIVLFDYINKRKIRGDFLLYNVLRVEWIKQ